VNSTTNTIAQLVVILVLNGFLQHSAADGDSTDAVLQELLPVSFTDINGEEHAPFEDDATIATAFVFVSTDCPVANAFQPTLTQILEDYSGEGIRFFMVHSSARVRKQEVVDHASDYRIRIPVVLDANQKIARMLQAKVTPEVIVVDRAGQVRYRGLINNLYAGYGKKRRAPTEHYLTDALDALIAGEPIVHAVTKPIGCFIHYQNTARQ